MNDILDGNDLPQDNVDYMAELTGPGKKFDRTKYQSEPEMYQAIAKGKYESDRYIPLLEKRSDEFRQFYLQEKDYNSSRANLEEIVDQLKSQPLPRSETPPATQEVRQPTIDMNQIRDLVNSSVQERETQKQQDANAKIVQDKIIERFGANYKEALKQQIDDLGISPSKLNEMARSEPRILMRALGLDQPQPRESFQAPPTSSQRNDNFAPRTVDRTWTWYEDLRKKDPKAYLSRETTVQMHKDYERLGAKFEDGDFKSLG